MPTHDHAVLPVWAQDEIKRIKAERTAARANDPQPLLDRLAKAGCRWTITHRPDTDAGAVVVEVHGGKAGYRFASAATLIDALRDVVKAADA